MHCITCCGDNIKNTISSSEENIFFIGSKQKREEEGNDRDFTLGTVLIMTLSERERLFAVVVPVKLIMQSGNNKMEYVVGFSFHHPLKCLLRTQ